MTEYADLAEAAWAWVLDQVAWDDGPWIPSSVPGSEPSWDRDGFHSGIGGLAHVLAEIRLARDWTASEGALATAIAERVRSQIASSEDVTFFDGLVSTIGVLIALDEPGAEQAVARIEALAHEGGWRHSTDLGSVPPDATLQDATLGTAGVLLGATWAARHRITGAGRLAERAADLLLAGREETATGTNWRFLPERQAPDYPQMPNFSHGLAGITAALAVAGRELDRADWVKAAHQGGQHLISLGRRVGDGFVVPRRIPVAPDQDELTHNWCHGGAGTSLAFAALEHAGLSALAGDTPATWRRRSIRGVRDAGVPERLYPGFWDNDGRCCGTAGVADVVLDHWQRHGDETDLEYAHVLTGALVNRAHRDGDHACWRFLEHTAAEPLLPPGVGWAQGTAGIAAYLFRFSRVLEQGRGAPVAARMDNWWAVS